MNDQIARLNSHTSARIYAAILLNQLDQIDAIQAAALAGVTSYNGYKQGLEELERAGLVEIEKQGKILLGTVLGHSQVEDDPEVQAAQLDMMEDDGEAHKPGSSYNAKRRAQIQFIKAIYSDVFPNKPVTEASIKQWLKAGTTVAIYEAITGLKGKDLQAPASYILKILCSQDAPKHQDTFKNEDDARKHWTPDPLNEKLMQLQKNGVKIERTRQKWQVE